VRSEAGDYPALYANLYDAITANDPSRLAVKPDEAVIVLKLIELAQKSSHEGQVLIVDF
jgi:scyllo-inositol 2-dehydrogenase (NADP+)